VRLPSRAIARERVTGSDLPGVLSKQQSVLSHSKDLCGYMRGLMASLHLV
jgi:hypothetical protein